MSDIRLVNVVPIVNGWNDAAKKNLEEAKTLMASGNHLDYNKGVVKESVANLVSGFEIVGRVVLMDKDSGRIFR